MNDSQEGLRIAYSLAERLEDAGESNWQILSLYFIIESYHLLYPASVLVGYTYFFAFSKEINSGPFLFFYWSVYRLDFF